ncbi:response regulator transcription factor [Emticicia sp. BO119]|uniref:response regulator n=1 Tax=Emticicia sp. BO119 TaxID=2757768 RepID=UPI0015F05BA4|nr:response regulator transcription factor [Emticicia sp. BO119]MBA4852840.1 response regulator transcription factor [Emticicia sp. BO119]
MRILIADDHEIFLDSLSLLIATFPDVELVGNCKSGTEVINFVKNDEIDLLITDYRMPLMSGIELTIFLRQHYPEIKVLMLSVSEEAEMIREAFQAGVWGYMMKRAGKTELQKAIQTIKSGQKYFSESVVFELMRLGLTDNIPKDDIPHEFSQLTEREIDIIRLLANELSSGEIAEKLFIAPKTVETHRHNILKKLNVKNTVGIIKYAIKNGLVD